MRHSGVLVPAAGAAERRSRLVDADGLLLLWLGQRLGQGLRVGMVQTSKVHTEGLGEGSEGPRGP